MTEKMKVVIITGMSGPGKPSRSTVLKIWAIS